MAKYTIYSAVTLYVPVKMELDKDPVDMTYGEWEELKQKLDNIWMDNFDCANIGPIEIENWQKMDEEDEERNE